MTQWGNSRYEVIVIGAGHNGLTAAALLAGQGLKVLVLEQSQTIGGIAGGDEFHPGYRTAGLLHDTSGVRPYVVKALSLQKHGLELLEERPSFLALGTNGSGLLLTGNAQRTAHEISRFSTRDADQYLNYRSFIERIQGLVRHLMDEPPPNIETPDFQGAVDLIKKGAALRLLGKKEMMEIFRISPMCVADWLNEWFDTDLLKAALAGPAIYGNFAGPWSPGTNANLLVWECTGRISVKGGPQSLVAALERAAKSSGADVVLGAKVERIMVAGGKAHGVQLEDGQRIEAQVVAASCDPRHTFLDLLSPRFVDYRVRDHIRNFRGRGTTAKVNLALSAPLEFACRPGEMVEFARTGDDFTHLEKAFDAVKYRRFSDAPVLDIHVPTVSSPQLAPKGHSVVSILVHFASYHLNPPWDEEQREKLGDLVVSTLEQYAPGISRLVAAREVLTPKDLRERYGLVEGNILHGEHCLDQLLVRPVPECAHYATPVPGLYLCGSGSHPGGGITCGPGYLAASVIVRERS